MPYQIGGFDWLSRGIESVIKSLSLVRWIHLLSVSWCVHDLFEEGNFSLLLSFGLLSTFELIHPLRKCKYMYYVGNTCLVILPTESCIIQCVKTLSQDAAVWHIYYLLCHHQALTFSGLLSHALRPHKSWSVPNSMLMHCLILCFILVWVRWGSTRKWPSDL